MKCEKCERLLKEVASSGSTEYRNCMSGQGAERAKVMLVGEALGRMEAIKGRPFVGDSGQLLRRELLIEQGINPEHLFITNAIKCRPLNNRAPTDKEVELCREHLVKEIGAVRPRVIVALGATALKALTGLTGITKLAGRRLYSYEFGAWVIPCLHPAALLRERQEGELLNIKLTLEALQRAMELSKSAVPRPPDVRKVVISEDGKEVDELLAALKAAERIVIDIETTGLDYRADAIRGVAFATAEDTAWFIAEGVMAKHKREFQKIIGNGVDKILHNVAFDARFLKRYGYPIGGKWVDTMLLHHLYDENLPHDLNTLSFMHSRFGGYKERLLSKSRTKKVYAEVDFTQLGEYACMDVLSTYALYKDMMQAGEEQGWLKLYSDIVEPTRKVLNDMSDEGTPIDVKYLAKLDEKLTNDLGIIEQVLKAMAKARGVEELNLNSPKQLAKFVYETLDLPVSKYTDTEAMSTDEEALRGIENRHPFPKLLLMYRQLDKMRSTYIEGTKEALKDGKLYTDFLSHGTVTGRLSARNPNLQNYPRDCDIRKLIAAPRGYRLVEVDGSQIEVRFLAHYTEEPFLIDAFKQGKDIHGEVAREILQRDYTKEERSCFKQIVFGISYGMEARGLATKLNEVVKRVDENGNPKPYTESDAEAYRQLFLSRMAEVPKWVEKTIKASRLRGYAVDMFGKRRRLPLLYSTQVWRRSEAERQCINSIIQGSASYCTNAALVRIAARLKRSKLRARLILTVHDSIIAVAPAKEAKRVQQLMVDEFEAVGKSIGSKVPIKADGEISQAWGEHKESAGVVWGDVGARVKEILAGFKGKGKRKKGVAA